MIPKEKAREIYEKFIKLSSRSELDISRGGQHNAKKCALIAVDELINAERFFETLASGRIYTKYWYEVQDEINKLL